MTGDGNERRVITRANLCDDYFDRLVIETSRVVRHRRELALDSLLDTPSESPSTSCDNSQEVAGPTGSWAGDEARPEQANGQPKRPMNAFMVWGQTIRRELHQRYSNVQNALLSKALGRVWRTMEAAEKEPYVRRANLIKANHKREYPNYRYQPRRIQERRNGQRNNMLIGINLNHPVNHQPQAPLSDTDLRAAIAQPSPTAGAQHQQQQPHQHQVALGNNQQQQLGKGAKFVRRNSVQTFEYYPYPLTAASAAFAANNPNLEQQFTTGCSDYGCANHDSYHHHHQQHQLQQPPAPPPQLLQSEPTVVYQSYQQFAYGNSNQNNISQQPQQYNHQHHRHQHPQLAYNDQRNHHHQGYGS